METMRTIRKEAIQFDNLDENKKALVELDDVISVNKYIVHDIDPEVSDEIRYEIETVDYNPIYVDKKTYDYISAYLIKQMIEKNQLIEED